MSTVRAIILSVMLLFVATQAVADDSMRVLPTPPTMSLAGTDSAALTKVYIVQLQSPSAAEHYASSSLAKTISGTQSPTPKLDKHNAAVQSYTQQIAAEQNKVLSSIGGGQQKIYSYQYSFNGFAARMTPAQADKLAADKRVLRVWEDEIRPLATRTSPKFLGLFDRDVGLRGAPGLDGDGVIIGVIDSGIAPGHPALRDTQEAAQPRLCAGSWGETSLLAKWLCRQYRVREDVLVFEPAENWNGICQTGDKFTADDCNNKLIGARYFVEGAQATLPIDSDELLSPADAYGHGTHVATTAAGNKVSATIFGTALGRIEGVAPKARVAVYKACWIRQGDSSATCNTSDLANAIDTAVADGVDIINYSVGSSLLNAIAPDDLALIAAAKAGVLSVVAAGNEGPNLATIGSPAGNPAVITVAASSRDGSHSLEALQVDSPASVAGRYEVKEASFTPPLQDSDPIEAELILVDDDNDTLANGSAGTRYDACEAISNTSEVSGKIAFVQRGGCDFDVKVENADNAGAIAVLVYNIAGNPIVMTGDSGFSDIPALMIGQADGMLLFDELNNDQVVNLVLEKGLLLRVDDSGNVMGGFSARGPGPVNDILKPDVTAPGINILAGSTPLSITTAPDENFAFLTGTSMATPHVAGTAALLMQAHPDWNPSTVKSALMTSARQDVDQQDGSTPAHPFDFGSGHIVPNTANDPGLVYVLHEADYDAYACGVESPAIEQARCDELAAGGRSFAAADMNLPSIAISRLSLSQTVRRTVTNVGSDTETYAAEIVAPAGISVQVTPASLTVPAGQAMSFDITFTYQSGPIDLWRFGSLTWASTDHFVRSPLAIRPTSVTAPEEVESFGGTGNLTFPVQFGYNGAYTPLVHGLKRATVIDGFVDQDPDRSFTFRNRDGVTAHVLQVSAAQAYVRFMLRDEFTDGDDDLDMYVYYSQSGNSGTFTRIGESGEFNSDEEFSLFQPAAGFYAILVHGFETDSTDPAGPGSNYKLLAWEFGYSDDVGNMTATGPTSVLAGNTEDITINWTNLGSNSIYLGAISHNTPQGIAAFTIVSIRN